jgi:hypothetical protein
MPVKIWNVGDVLAAADVNSWLAPLAGVKSANQTIQTATFVNDADMRFACAANSIYEFHVFIRWSSGTGQDFKSSMTVPAGAAAHFARYGTDATGAFTGDGDFADTDTLVSKGFGVGTSHIHTLNFFGWLDTASTAGNLIFQWAQNTQGNFDTTLYANSYLSGRRIG